MYRTKLKAGVLVLILFAVAIQCSRSSPAPQESESSPSGLAILTTPVLRLGYLGRRYLAVFKATHGSAPYRWALVEGDLPRGLSFDGSKGEITGKPAEAGRFALTIAVTDSTGTVARKTFRLWVPDLRLDEYGGLMSMPSPGRGSGYFRLEKFGRRWMFVTPAGHAFWLFAVQNACYAYLNPGVLDRKYSGNVLFWGDNTSSRLQSWGFNALGEYTGVCISPVGVWGRTTYNMPQMPVILLLRPAYYSTTNPPSAELHLAEPVKDVIAGVPRSTYNGWRAVLPDVFDPKFAKACQGLVSGIMKPYRNGFADNPWILGITIDDADELFGFKSGGNAPINAYENPAFMVATSRFEYTAEQNTRHANWIDPKLYSKYAWIDFLKQKYNNSIAALNAAWGTRGFYTSFGDAGGYGTGTGVLDEDGRHSAWMGNDPYMLDGSHTQRGSKCYLGCKAASPAVRADINAFLYVFVKKYTETVVAAIRAADKHHLIFGPDAINNYGAKARNEVLKGLADGGIDAFIWNYNPNYGGAADLAGSMVENNESYDLTGKPAYLWYTLAANGDSSLTCTRPSYGITMLPSQKARGEHYATVDIPNFVNARGSNGDYYVLGIDWWDLFDTPAECGNWGLLTRDDNAYDGREAVRRVGADSWGFSTGGERSDYGDFLDSVQAANLKALKRISGGH